jgi:hypothetical protein
MFMCGSKTVTLATVMHFTYGWATQCNTMKHLFAPAAARHRSNNGRIHLMAISYFRDKGRNHDPNTVVLQALESFSIRDATDPRDKIFGILGILSLEQKRQFITVDYTRSVEGVYIDVATSLIERFKNFDTLYFAGTDIQKL